MEVESVLSVTPCMCTSVNTASHPVPQLKKLHTNPLVIIQAEGEWSADWDALVTYSTQEPFPSSTWDWIGLYKVRLCPAPLETGMSVFL